MHRRAFIAAIAAGPVAVVAGPSCGPTNPPPRYSGIDMARSPDHTVIAAGEIRSAQVKITNVFRMDVRSA